MTRKLDMGNGRLPTHFSCPWNVCSTWLPPSQRLLQGYSLEIEMWCWGYLNWVRDWAQLKPPVYRTEPSKGIQAYLILSDFTLLYFAVIAHFFFFLQIEGMWQPCIKQVCSAIFPTAFVHIIVSVSHFGNSHNISNFFIIITFIIIIIFDLWSVIFDVAIAKRLWLTEGSDDG